MTKLTQQQLMKDINAITLDIEQCSEEHRILWWTYLLEAIESEMGVDALDDIVEVIHQRFAFGGW